MFTTQLDAAAADPRALLELGQEVMVEERMAGCRKLQVAAAWADCHGAPDDQDAGPRSALVDNFVQLGGRGTPLVAEDCAGELAMVWQTSVFAARSLIADALTIRHRLPGLWQRVADGEVWAWKARKIAQATRHLNVAASGEVDRLTTPYVETTAWGRFLDLLDATVLHVDETTYQQRKEAAASQKGVRSYRGEYGLRTLVAKAEAGDILAFEALLDRVAACLAEDGDEDPVGVRRSKAFGIIAHPARLRDLLARHADQADDPRHPEQRVAAHQADPSDPWAADDLPDAGWETSRHGNYHQPGFDDLDDLDDAQTSRTQEPEPDSEPDTSVPEADRAWYDQHRDDDRDRDDVDADRGDAERTIPVDADDPPAQRPAGTRDNHANTDVHDHPGEPEPIPDPDHDKQPVPDAFDRHATGADAPLDGHCCGCACGSSFDLRPMSSAELTACRTRAIVHVHVTDQTLLGQHGVLRTVDGPITYDQFRQWLTDADPNITIRPVLDPANVAAVDNYEIPLAMREALHTRHPGSIWPFSPTTEISVGGRLDLDHNSPYRKNGPPGQTATGNLGPVARTEHLVKTHGRCHVRQPDPGTYLWRSTHGLVSIVTNQGTLMLGNTPWAHQIWQTAQPEQTKAA